MKHLHPGRLTWNLRIHPWKRKIIFQTIIFRFYVNLPGCISEGRYVGGRGVWLISHHHWSTMIAFQIPSKRGPSFIKRGRMADAAKPETWRPMKLRKADRFLMILCWFCILSILRMSVVFLLEDVYIYIQFRKKKQQWTMELKSYAGLCLRTISWFLLEVLLLWIKLSF